MGKNKRFPRMMRNFVGSYGVFIQRYRKKMAGKVESRPDLSGKQPQY
jgi:hypothetical protein